MANNSFMGQRRRPLMPSFPGSQFRKKNPYFQNVANDPGTAPRAKQVMTLKDRRVLVVYQSDRRARRIILRFDHGHGRIVVVLPKRVSLPHCQPTGSIALRTFPPEHPPQQNENDSAHQAQQHDGDGRTVPIALADERLLVHVIGEDG